VKYRNPKLLLSDSKNHVGFSFYAVFDCIFADSNRYQAEEKELKNTIYRRVNHQKLM